MEAIIDDTTGEWSFEVLQDPTLQGLEALDIIWAAYKPINIDVRMSQEQSGQISVPVNLHGNSDLAHSNGQTNGHTSTKPIPSDPSDDLWSAENYYETQSEHPPAVDVLPTDAPSPWDAPLPEYRPNDRGQDDWLDKLSNLKTRDGAPEALSDAW